MQEKLFNRLMDVIEYDVAPLTRKRVAIGCKVFGAAVLRKDDLSPSSPKPIWRRFPALARRSLRHQAILGVAGPSRPQGLHFHRHASALLHVRVGHRVERLPELFYLFGYENTSKDFHIPHDQKMIRELFHCTSPAEDSSYYTSRPIMGLCDTPEAAARFERIKNLYAELSAVYQAGEKKMVLS